MDKYYPAGDRTSTFTVYGYSVAQTMVQVLKQCGDNLIITPDNVMWQAANIHDLQLGILLPGITINTSPIDFAPIKQMQMETVQWPDLGTVWLDSQWHAHRWLIGDFPARDAARRAWTTFAVRRLARMFGATRSRPSRPVRLSSPSARYAPPYRVFEPGLPYPREAWGYAPTKMSLCH